MDKEDGRRGRQQAPLKLGERRFLRQDGLCLFARQHRNNRLAYANQITLQFALIASLLLVIYHLLSPILRTFPLFSMGFDRHGIASLLMASLLLYLLLRRATPRRELSADVGLMVDQQVQAHVDARTDELTRQLTQSQGVNARLEGLLADQTAITVENARLHEEAGQIAIMAERQRLGRDLHDSVTQALYSMVLFADATRLALAADKQVEAIENLQQVRTMARQAMADMRLLIYQLHPPLLKKEGLAAALQTRLEAVESRAGLHTEFRSEGVCELSPMLEGEFYRIAQEALNNVIKHAKAEHVSIELICHGKHSAMSIRDDGIGFEVATAQAGGGVGLRSMAERAQQLNALLTFDSSPTHGTTVRIEV